MAETTPEHLNAQEEERRLHLTKNRIAAVDIARLLAAMIVMYSHLENFNMCGVPGKWLKFILNESIGTCSSIFFLFAGYFACRAITWKKAADNAWWCFAPFLLWVGLCALVAWQMAPDLWVGRDNISSILGIDTFTTLYAHNITPINGPLWFMRDLVFLFLLSPLLFRWSRWLFPLIVLLSITPGFAPLFEPNPGMVLSPYSLGFFTLGCFLRGISKESQQALLRFHSPFYIAVFFALGIGMGLVGEMYWWDAASAWRHWSFLPAVLSIWALYQTARCIEVHCPRLTQLCLKLAPVTFLTFAAHWPIYILVYVSPLRESLWTLLLPWAVLGLMTAFFFALKRWARPLLHLVAHYKLRPDDMQATAKN